MASSRAGFISEQIEIDDAHGLKQIPTADLIFLSIKPRNQGNTHGDALRICDFQKPPQIVEHPGIVLTGVTAVDVRIGVFAIDIKMVDAVCGLGHRLPRHIESRFCTQVPVGSANPRNS